jgi:transcriptional regulator with XRE-family HTH domain
MTTNDTTKRGSLRDRIAALREQNPHIAETEKALGVRLTIARNVLRLRVRAGMSQRELAERAGMSQPRIAEIENASVNFGVDTLSRLAGAFCVPEETLVKVGERQPVTRAISASPSPQRPQCEELGATAWTGPKQLVRASGAVMVAYDEPGNG